MRHAKQSNGVYDRAHIIPCYLRKNPMTKHLIIPQGSETHLRTIALDAVQETRPPARPDEERDQ